MRQCKMFSRILLSIEVALVLALSIAPTESYALPETSTIEALNREGIALFKQKNYAEAIDRFEKAYAMEPDSSLIFNIARCQERLGNKDIAITKYEEFLLQPEITTAFKLKAKKRLEVLKAPVSAPEPTKPEPKTDKPVPDNKLNPDPVKQKSSSNSTYAWILLASGAAFGLAGTYFYLDGSSDHSKVEDDPGYQNSGVASQMNASEAKDYIDSGSSKKNIGGALLIVGGAALVGSTALFVLGGSDKAESAPVSFGISPNPTGGFASIQGRF